MARIRTIKPEFWVSEQIAECSASARLTFVGLWTFCDDNGVHPAKPKTLKAKLYPMDDISAGDVADWMQELIRVGLVAEFEADGATYWHVTGWTKHQKIDRPSYKYPTPPSVSTTPRQALAESSTNTSEDSSDAPPRMGMDRNGVEGKGVDSESRTEWMTAPAQAKSTESRKSRQTQLPGDFGISDRVKTWASKHGHTNLQPHLDALVSYAKRKGATYADWDEALMTAVRNDWGKTGPAHGLNGHAAASSVLTADEQLLPEDVA